MEKDYWINFWKTFTDNFSDKDAQTQVLRTLNKKPISEKLWDFTLQQIDQSFKVENGDRVLDLCAGNGLFSKHFAAKGASVTAVDISSELLKQLEFEERIDTITSDIRLVEFNAEYFDNVFFYAGIQYLTDKEAIELLLKIYRWLKPGGSLFIGDIPDLERRWIFFDNESRREAYFSNKLANKAIVGNWFEKNWFYYLGNYVGFSNAKYIPQHEDLIYSKFRFDYCYLK